ncbi:MAG: gamma-glutamyltransferase [Pseudomonadota bacterium]
MANRSFKSRVSVAAACVAALVHVAGSAVAQQAQPSIIDYGARHHAATDADGMVAVQNAIAAEVGAAVLADGGNAVDAAVAVGMTLAVTLPRAGNLGGGGFMLVYLAEDDQTIAIDYRERAPAAATRDMYLDENGDPDPMASRFSYRAAGVPGTVAGMHHALSRYGTMSWEQILLPAIRIAENGMRVSPDLAQALARRRDRLGRDPATLKAYYKPNGEPYATGEILKQPDLAWSLKRIAANGPDAFYRGAIADRIVAAMEANGGLITAEDLASYAPTEREPVQGTYRGLKIVAMPPPSSGGVLIIQMLNVLEQFDLAEAGFGSAQHLHWMTEVMRTAYADRSQHLGDPDFYREPYDWLMSKAYAQEIAAQIDPAKARKSALVAPAVAPVAESPDTTHYGIMDRDGNTVVNTYTLNFSYGSGITIPGTGILLNNEMDDFSAKPGTPNGFGLLGNEANAIGPGKRPLSSMTPTIVFRDGRPWIATGSPGGSRIITTVLQVMINLIDFEMSPSDAVAAPRIHHQWFPDKLFMEAGFSPDTFKLLQSMGHDADMRRRTMGSAQTIVFEDGLMRGAADPRRPDALALGPRDLRCRNGEVACAH